MEGGEYLKYYVCQSHTKLNDIVNSMPHPDVPQREVEHIQVLVTEIYAL